MQSCQGRKVRSEGYLSWSAKPRLKHRKVYVSTVISRCELCPGVNKCVQPSYPKCTQYTSELSPVKSTICFIGEAPGVQEDRAGKPFVGKTGQEFNEHYLPLAGLRRSDVFVGNAISCLPVRHGGKLDMGNSHDVALLECCAAHHLYGELEQLRPRLIVPMGAFACRAIDPDIDLELQHGKPIQTAWGEVFPMYHPATGLHEPKRMLMIRSDFCRLGKYLRGKLYVPVDQYPHPEYRRVNGTSNKSDG